MDSQSWKIIAASIAGTSHLAKDLPCQDAFQHQILHTKNGEEILVVVASDGAGSAKNALIGAQTTCRFFIRGVGNWLASGKNLENLNEDFAQSFIELLQSELAKLAETESPNLADFSCTLLAAIIGENSAVFWQIGDGAIVFADAEAEDFELFTLPQQGEYANSTNFVTDSDAVKSLVFRKIEKRIVEIAIFTDGLQRIALNFQTNSAHSPFFRPMFAPLRSEKLSPNLEKNLAEFLNSAKINERTDDDKTLILASRKR